MGDARATAPYATPNMAISVYQALAYSAYPLSRTACGQPGAFRLRNKVHQLCSGSSRAPTKPRASMPETPSSGRSARPTDYHLAPGRAIARYHHTVTHPQHSESDPPDAEAEPPPTAPAGADAAAPRRSADPSANARTAESGTEEPSGAGSNLSQLPLAAPALGLTGAIILAALFSTLSASLLRSLPSLLDDAQGGSNASAELRRHLGAELEKAERLAAGASVAAFVFRAGAVACLFVLLRKSTDWGLMQSAGVSAIAGGLVLHLFTQSLPLALAQSRANALLTTAVPAFALTLRPFTWAASMLSAIRRPILRVLRTPDADHGTRRLVEGFRAMVEESSLAGDLAAGTREMIANVIDFGDVDAAEVMTPRTEIHAIEKDESMQAAIAVFAASGYSRIPVYAETVDSIIGTLTALEAAKAVVEGRLETTRIVQVMRPPLLVPETKLVPELLTNFREQKQKMAIVVDEYGGTAGLVTLADVMAEIVGDVEDEFTDEDQSFVTTERGAMDVDASLHVSEINEELGLELPEEADFETLGGFVLSELGHFPQRGELFDSSGTTFRVTDASDRRVLRVEIDRGQAWREERLKRERERLEAAQNPEKRNEGSLRALRHSQAS